MYSKMAYSLASRGISLPPLVTTRRSVSTVTSPTVNWLVRLPVRFLVMARILASSSWKSKGFTR